MTAARSKTGTLTANTVATVTFAARYDQVEVRNLVPEGGTTADVDALYVTTDGTVPTYQGDDCDEVIPGTSIVVPNRLTGMWYQSVTAMNGGAGCTYGNNAALQGLSGSSTGSATDTGTTVKIISGSATTPSYSVVGVG